MSVPKEGLEAKPASPGPERRGGLRASHPRTHTGATAKIRMTTAREIVARSSPGLPEFERRSARFSRPINSSWRVDETPYLFKRDGITSIRRSIAMENPFTRCFQWIGP